MDPPPLMRAGEVVRRSGVSHRTLHFYESMGLIGPASREGGGYRHYDDQTLRRLAKIGQLKRLGLSLEEIASVIDLYFEDQSGAKGKSKVIEILRRHLADVEARQAELTEMKQELLANIERLERLLADARRR